MPSSIKRNFVFNLINTLSGLLFPLITFPYASRILLAEGIGKIQFFQSIIGYISLCTALGIPLYAVREIARARDDKALCSRIAIEILILHSILTLVGYCIVYILIITVAKIQVDVLLFLLLSTNLFFTAIGALWFYQGIEDFKYITIRALVIRVFSLICLFLFVKDKSDLFTYAAISVIAEVGSNIFNFIRLRKFIIFKEISFNELNPWRHLRPALKIFALNLITSIYVNLDSVMLGFLKNEMAVGYYSAATRITKSILGVVQSLGAVLLPRFANLVSTNQLSEFRALANKAISFILATSLPLVIGLIFMASPLIHLFCGKGFEPSILTLQLMAPIILFIGISGIMGMQVLYALGRENIVIISTGAGALINFILNLLLIPQYSQYGSGFATCIAEFSVTSIMILLGWKYMPIRLLQKQNKNYYLGMFSIFIFLFILSFLKLSELFYSIIGISCSILLYLFFLYWKKDILIMQLIDIITTKFKR